MEQQLAKQAMTPEHPLWEQMIGRQEEMYQTKGDFRPAFTRDYTRVLHSLAYRRLKHKTQVFFNAAGNDHICTRIEHVLHVESVSNSIALQLGLNTELTKAIAIAHDLGHAPFGHQGEKVMDGLFQTYLNKKFWHEKNGVYFVDQVELLEDPKRNLRNLNLTYGVRDGIISHCGEVDCNGLRPREECFPLKEFQQPGEFEAASWEGCVVKLADKIAYIGRDIEDGIRLGYLKQEQIALLKEMAKLNRQESINTTVLMHNMIIDLCTNSTLEKGLTFCPEMYDLLTELKQFNYQHIYHHKKQIPVQEYAKLVLEQLFATLLDFYQGETTIWNLKAQEYDKKHFLKEFVNWLVQYCEFTSEEYRQHHMEQAAVTVELCKNKKIYHRLEQKEFYLQAVLDFMAGMTDSFASNAFMELLQG